MSDDRDTCHYQCAKSWYIVTYFKHCCEVLPLRTHTMTWCILFSRQCRVFYWIRMQMSDVRSPPNLHRCSVVDDVHVRVFAVCACLCCVVYACTSWELRSGNNVFMMFSWWRTYHVAHVTITSSMLFVVVKMLRDFYHLIFYHDYIFDSELWYSIWIWCYSFDETLCLC